MTTPEVKENYPVCTWAGRLRGGQKGRRRHPIISVDIHPQASGGIHLSKKLRTRVGEGPRAGQVWKRNKIIGQM